MADTQRIYTIKLEGVQDAISQVESLSTALGKLGKEHTTAVKSTDELSKVTKKLSDYDADYAKEVERARQALAAKKKEVQDEVKQEQALQTVEQGVTASYADKQKLLTALGKTIKNMVVTNEEEAKTMENLKSQYATLNQELKDFDASLGNHQRNVGDYAIAGESLKGTLKELQTQMAEMLANGVSPTDEGFVKLATQAGKLKDAISDASATVQRFASDTRSLDQVINIGQTLTATYGTVKGTMALFGQQGEELAKTFVKLQAAMTTLNSLHTLQENLLKQGTATNTLYTKAMEMLGIATEGTTTATKALKIGLASLGIGLITAAVAYLVENWEELSKWFTDTFPVLENLSDAFDTIKDVVMAVGKTVLEQVVIPFQTMIGVVKKIMEGDFKGAFDTALDGVKNFCDVGGRYMENYAEETGKSAEKRALKVIEEQNKELQKLIEVNEAKYGSDWKYTEDGQKLYKKYFDNLTKLAKNNADEYHKVTVQKANYDREVTEKQEKEEAKRQELAQKSLEAHKKTLEEARKQWESYLKTVEQYVNTGHSNLMKMMEDSLNAQIKALTSLTGKTREEVEATNKELESLYERRVDLELKAIDEEIAAENKQYEELVSQAKGNQEVIERLTETHNNNLKILYEAQGTAIETAVTERNAAEKSLTEEFLKNQLKSLQKSDKDVENEYKESTQKILKLVKDLGDVEFHLSDIKEFKSERSEISGEIDKLKGDVKGLTSVVDEQKKKWEEYLDFVKEVYGEDSEEYAQAQKDKEDALEGFDTSMNEFNDKVGDDDTPDQFADRWNSAFESIQGAIDQYVTVFTDSFNAIMDSVDGLLGQKVDEAQAYYDKVAEQHQEAQDKLDETRDKISEIENKMKNANANQRKNLASEMAEEQKILEERYAAEQELQAEQEAADQALADAELKQKRAELAQDLVMAIVNTSLAAVKAMGQYGWPMGLVAAAAMTAAGAVEIATISRQISQLGTGGYIEGPSHSEGGVPVGNTGITVEGGEYVVNKKSTARYSDLIEAINSGNDSLIAKAYNDMSYRSREVVVSLAASDYAGMTTSTDTSYQDSLTAIREANDVDRLIESFEENQGDYYVAVTDYEKVAGRLAKTREYAQAR